MITCSEEETMVPRTNQHLITSSTSCTRAPKMRRNAVIAIILACAIVGGTFLVALRSQSHSLSSHMQQREQAVLQGGSVARRDITSQDVDELVTIVIRTFLRRECCLRAIKSVRQLYPTIPLIVADDSPDNFEYEGAQTLHLPFNSGVSYGRNKLAEAAETPYVFIIDDDFILTNNNLDELVMILEDLDADIVAPKLYPSPTNANVYGMVINNGTMAVFPNATTFNTVTNPYGCIQSNYVLQHYLARRDALLTIRWDDSLKVIDHEDFMIRAHSMNIKMFSCANYVVAEHASDSCPRPEAYASKRDDTEHDDIQTMQKNNLHDMVINWDHFHFDTRTGFEAVRLNEHWDKVENPDEVQDIAERSVFAYNSRQAPWNKIIKVSAWNAWRCDLGLLGEFTTVVVEIYYDRPSSFYRAEEDPISDRQLKITLLSPPKLSPLTLPFMRLQSSRRIDQNEMVWIVVPLYNNVESYRSWLEQAKALPTTQSFSVLTVDLSSTDSDITAEFDRTGLPGFVHTVPTHGKFCRSLSLTLGIHALPDDASLVVILDASTAPTANLLNLVRRTVVKGERMFSPIQWTVVNGDLERTVDARGPLAHFYSAKERTDTGFWLHAGYGLFAFHREDFIAIGGYDHPRWGCRWGGEDLDIALRAIRQGYRVHRHLVPGLLRYEHKRVAGYRDPANVNKWEGEEPVIPISVEVHDASIINAIQGLLGGSRKILLDTVIEHMPLEGHEEHLYEAFFFDVNDGIHLRATTFQFDLVAKVHEAIFVK
eukprot:m.55011 g.55011  ORF g.55011 m.55011 type:complete len:767 (+) comp11464_c0_seq2:301-2601(+)